MAGLLDQVNHVSHHVLRIESVDAHRKCDAACFPVQIIDRFDDQLARLDLVIRRDSVFKIEKNEICTAVQCFFKHLGIGARHGKIAALNTLYSSLIYSVTHLFSRKI